MVVTSKIEIAITFQKEELQSHVRPPFVANECSYTLMKENYISSNSISHMDVLLF